MLKWSTEYQTGDGWVCRLELEGDNSKTLFDQVTGALSWLQRQDARPINPYVAPTAAAVASNLRAALAGPAPSATNGGAYAQSSALENDSAWCPIHGVEMRRHEGENGRHWYSHQVDGAWCRGKRRG